VGRRKRRTVESGGSNNVEKGRSRDVERNGAVTRGAETAAM
jgi:hypothetical protein